jgi:hypothetical protein
MKEQCVIRFNIENMFFAEIKILFGFLSKLMHHFYDYRRETIRELGFQTLKFGHFFSIFSFEKTKIFRTSGSNMPHAPSIATPRKLFNIKE